ncbi:DUF1643 domain-containing protein [Burkholderia gladioli]|uniref:DUF1643 domain-containing protein n=1 Tax=Burkholderia gladioli TaxID=28095 RepID=UPI00163E2DA5|nr:DUF1643 domain-containing protein [Burkholderia gladioli]
MSAIISDCGAYRYRLEREVNFEGPVYAFIGVNPSTADASADDPTIRKLIGFVSRWGGSRLIVGNAFAYRATNVRALAGAADPHGPLNGSHLVSIFSDADIIVPCWGNSGKVPERLRDEFSNLRRMLLLLNRPIRVFGLTASRDPLHPLMLGYSMPLIEWPELREVAR